MPCKPDAIEYDGFNPSAKRQLCMTTNAGSMYEISFPYETTTQLFASELDTIDSQRNDSLVYLLANVFNGGGLHIYGLHNRVYHVLSLVLIPGQQANFTAYNLLLPTDIAVQAANAMKRLPYPNMALCQSTVHNASWILLECPPSVYNDPTDFNVQLLYMHMGTEQVRARKSKVVRNEIVSTFPIIGSINRPRLSILPALILLAVIVLIHFLIWLLCEQRDPEFKLWSYVNSMQNTEHCAHPFESPCSDVERSIA